MIAYRVNFPSKTIEEIEIERFTPQFVVLKTKNFRGKNDREAREYNWRGYYETMDEAIKELEKGFVEQIARFKRYIRETQIQLEQLEVKYEQFLADIKAEAKEGDDGF